jgi:5-formyltetrahydrofolate cyclo-ligase
MTDDTTNHAADEENQLRIRLSDLRRRYEDQAQPIIERLTKLEAMKPANPIMVYADIAPALAMRAMQTPLPDTTKSPLDLMFPRQQGKSHAAKVMQDLATMIEEAKGEAAAVAKLRNHIYGHAITRTWADEEGNLEVERIAPEDFYAKPEGEQ